MWKPVLCRPIFIFIVFEAGRKRHCHVRIMHPTTHFAHFCRLLTNAYAKLNQ